MSDDYHQMTYNPDSGSGAPPPYGAQPTQVAAPPPQYYGDSQPAQYYGGGPAAQPYGYPASQQAYPAQSYPAQSYPAQSYPPQQSYPQGYAPNPYAQAPAQSYPTGVETRPMVAPAGGNTFVVEGETVIVEDIPSSETLNPEGCGSTKQGKRLDLENREYRDIWAGILFGVVIICLFIGLGTSFSGGNTKGSPGIGIAIVVIAAVVGLCMGFMWLKFLKWNSEMIIKAMLLGYFGMLCIFTIVALIINILFGILMILITAVFALYLWCQWPRVVLAAAFIEVSSKIIEEFPATVGVTISMLAGAIAYLFLWSAVVVGYASTENANGFVVFLLLICGYWGLGVAANVSHFTTLVVAFQYYFNRDEPSNPTWKGFELAMTKSFGSICLGSLIVAVIQAMRAVARQARERGSIVGCIAECILGCLESWSRFFSLWSYSYCSLYGHSFREAGGEMWDLFRSKGMDMLVTTDFTGFALMAGALVGGLVAGIIGFIIGLSVCNGCSANTRSAYGVLYGILSLIIGYYTCWLVMFAVRSGVVALFTAWAEDPQTFFITHPAKAKKFAAAWNKSRQGIAARRCG